MGKSRRNSSAIQISGKSYQFPSVGLEFYPQPLYSQSLSLSVHLYKDCGETVFTLCCKVHGIKELLGEQNILSCFCHQIKAPGLEALTKASEERRGNLSHLGPKPGWGAAHSSCDSLESMRSLGGPGSIDRLCHRHADITK